MEDDEMSQAITDMASNLPPRLKELREERGWSQQALATRMEQLGFSSWRQTTVAKVEAAKGPRTLSFNEAVGLAFAFGLPGLHHLFGEESRVSQQLVQNFTDVARASHERRARQSLEALRRAGASAAELAEAEQAFARIGEIQSAGFAQIDAEEGELMAAVEAFEAAEMPADELAALITTRFAGSPASEIITTALAASERLSQGEKK
jgi:transcriptional regulator with XRE-family HTH domain